MSVNCRDTRRKRTGVTSTSIWTHYERGERVFCGHELPDGLRKHQRLPEPMTQMVDALQVPDDRLAELGPGYARLFEQRALRFSGSWLSEGELLWLAKTGDRQSFRKLVAESERQQSTRGSVVEAAGSKIEKL